MNEKYTHISLLVDESGSMGHLRETTISTINEFIEKFAKEVAEDGRKITISINKFSDSIRKTPIDFTDVINPIRFVDYLPGGMTALYDGIHFTIDETGKRLSEMSEDERPSRVIIAIVTDGEENSSENRDPLFLAEKIKHQESVYSWTFMYLGANQDAIISAANIGISSGKAMTFYANNESVKSVGDVLRRKVSFLSTMDSMAYASMASSDTEELFNQEDRTEVEKK